MEKESKSAGGIPFSGIMAIVMLAAGGLFIRAVPLEATRPPVNEQRMDRGSASQDMDARLWQDPFGAVARAREAARKHNPAQARTADQQRTKRLLADISERTQPPGGKVEVLAVMLPGGSYSEDIESRRRMRYAVLAGLNASRLVPFDAEHLGYFFPSGVDKPGLTLPEIVPFEWFEPVKDNERGTLPWVLVMWIDSTVFKNQPLHQLRELTRTFDHLPVSWRVLGPPRSDGLRDMVNEARPAGATPLQDAPTLHIYSAIATAPDTRLAPELQPGGTLHRFFAGHNVNLVRTIGDDDQLADALIKELALRGLRAGKRASKHDATCELSNREGPSHVAIISEWDTLYGRTLRREFQASPDEDGFCTHRSSYVRGLDGQLPSAGGADAAAAKTGPAKFGSEDKNDSRQRDGSYIEIAEGQSQFDYLRRLAKHLTEVDQDMRKKNPDGLGLRAIGVLGSDVHDKLLVLQALQPEFPNAIFFTTDMDARFLHPREQAWTRNLLVASHFNLRLSDTMQSDMPTLRDSYQTSLFLATRLAIDDAQRALAARTGAAAASTAAPTSQQTIAQWLREPRVFEIGRTQAFDFSPPSPQPPAASAEPRSACKGPYWLRCGGNLHPAPSPPYPHLRMATLLFIASLLCLMLWLPPILVSRSARRRLLTVCFTGSTVQRAWRWGTLAALFVVVQLALPLLLAYCWDPFASWLTRDGKPLVGLEGISSWPTEAIRLLTLLLCLYLIYAGWTALSQNLDDIIEHFQLGPASKHLVAEQRAADRHLPRWSRFINMFSLHLILSPDAPRARPDEDFWRRYVVQNRIGARAMRTTACVLLAVGGSWFLLQALNDPPFIPQRGQLSLTVHQWLHCLMFIAIYFLVFFVVDATTFCVSFVRGLPGARWPSATLLKFEHDLWMPRACLNDWIDLEFIARRTRCVTRLIYCPFIVLSLFLVSRRPIFDHWHMPVTGIVLAVLGAAISLGCAVALRYAAEAARSGAVKKLRDEIMRANGVAPAAPRRPMSSGALLVNRARPLEPPKPAQLTLLLERIEHLHEGAFAPFWQQPLLKAVLLPFAAFGGTSMLDYMALVNI
ncbi:hypothetical protein [Duganella sp. HH105]|uniref:hypothetical protein n=1 Tax=Duganella sp. HH105 TaxID=1781067 RepID=UPI000877D4E1|nr:hypothetical protein [Duganella sp. HH105]OEZ61778.1 hypothetical protein DUGA6_22290 [Duganella sp. HH105]